MRSIRRVVAFFIVFGGHHTVAGDV